MAAHFFYDTTPQFLSLPITRTQRSLEETKGHVLELTVLLFPVRDGRLTVVLHKTVVDWLMVPNVHPTS